MTERDPDSTPPTEGFHARGLRLSVFLFTVTFLAVTSVGAQNAGVAALDFAQYGKGLPYSVPLMAILLAHELGHYIAARIHHVPASPPFFVPMPIPPLGTMGAVILMRGRITRRNALLDIGAAGPLAGLCVALPVLAYGIWQSPVTPIPTVDHWMEGHSLLYTALLWLIKGPFPAGHDILLSPTAFAGWAGLLVTMLNLIPAVQLDGGHVAYALFGERQQRYSRALRRLLLPLAVLVSLAYGIPALLSGVTGDALTSAFAPGLQWAVWWLLLRFMARGSAVEHPETDDTELSPRRRALAWFTLSLFILLFMPAWLRAVPGAGT
jgi:membrane-associated protease RseP (regulator of RpoE activity)